MASKRKPGACVYTVLVNDYEELNEQPAAAESTLDFICLTDRPQLTSDTWSIRSVDPLFPADPARSQRYLKICAHRALPEYDVSLYIDNSVILKRPPEELIESLLSAESTFSLLEHSFRDTMRDEFEQVILAELDAASVCDEQLAHYEIADAESLAMRPLWSGILVRRHHDATVVAAMETWYAHVLRYSRRDQLSVWVALRSARLSPQIHRLDNHESAFHRWPVTPGRDRLRAGVPWALSLELDLEVSENERRRLENVRQRLDHELRLLRGSRSWRLTAPLRGIRRRLGTVAAFIPLRYRD
jgi:hypothetical protein